MVRVFRAGPAHQTCALTPTLPLARPPPPSGIKPAFAQFAYCGDASPQPKRPRVASPGERAPAAGRPLGAAVVDVPDSPSAVADADDDVVVVAASAPPCRVLHDSDDDVHCLPAAPATQGGRRRAIVLDDDDDDDLAAVPAPATGARGAVPAAVQDAVPAAFEDADEDGPDDVVAECERISGDLRAALGSGLAPDGRFAATDAAPAALATRDDLVAAAGPGSAAGTLKPYQVVGVNFLLLLKNTGIGGAIVADEARRQWSCGGEGGGGVAVVACACPAPTCFRPHQPTRPPPAHPFRQMGLGKTAQAAVFLAVRAAQYGDGPFLVVVPSSLLDNWARELAAWAPSLRVARFYGPHRAAVRRVAAGGGPDSGFDVMLVSYPMFERAGDGAKLDRVFVRKFAWSIAVLDEAHAVKNAGSGRSARLRAVVEGADMRVLLTGTPLQNQASELRALLAFMLPTLFGAEGGVDDADAVDAGLGSAAAVTRLRRTLAPFILRRLKTEVASQLVAKTRETRRVALTDAQADAYVAAVAALRAEAQAAVARGGEGEAGDAGLGDCSAAAVGGCEAACAAAAVGAQALLGSALPLLVCAAVEAKRRAELEREVCRSL